MKATGLFLICKFVLFTILVSARHTEDGFESGQLTEFENSLDQRNYHSKRETSGPSRVHRFTCRQGCFGCCNCKPGYCSRTNCCECC